MLFKWRNKVTTSPSNVEPGDGFAIKVVACVQGEYWKVYCGPSDWSDQKVADCGDRVYLRAAAESLFYVLARSRFPFDFY